MAQQEDNDKSRFVTRRSFLGKASLGLAAAVALGVTSGKLFLAPLTGRKQPPSFPKDSIFTPREDPRL